MTRRKRVTKEIKHARKIKSGKRNNGGEKRDEREAERVKGVGMLKFRVLRLEDPSSPPSRFRSHI
jgi:hypothetical protein